MVLMVSVRDRTAQEGFEEVIESLIKQTEAEGVWMDCELLDEDLVGEYMAIELGVKKVPEELVKYVSDITMGNPYFIRESMDNLT